MKVYQNYFLLLTILLMLVVPTFLTNANGETKSLSGKYVNSQVGFEMVFPSGWYTNNETSTGMLAVHGDPELDWDWSITMTFGTMQGGSTTSSVSQPLSPDFIPAECEKLSEKPLVITGVSGFEAVYECGNEQKSAKANLVGIFTENASIIMLYDADFYEQHLSDFDNIVNSFKLIDNSVKTDKTSYTYGEIITVSGSVTPIAGINTVTIKIRNPAGALIAVQQPNIAQNGTYSTTFQASGVFWDKNGNYMVSAEYNFIVMSSTQFNFVGLYGPNCVPITLGDWNITSDCLLANDSTVTGNVIVDNGAVLTIPNGVTLHIDFATKHLLVKSGSGVLIKTGGKIASIPAIVMPHITVSTDKTSYVRGETITVSGSIDPVTEGTLVNLRINDPSCTPRDFFLICDTTLEDNFFPAAGGSFSKTYVADGFQFNENGVYTVLVYYDSPLPLAETFFALS